jgi:hypothetical protein
MNCVARWKSSSPLYELKMCISASHAEEQFLRLSSVGTPDKFVYPVGKKTTQITTSAIEAAERTSTHCAKHMQTILRSIFPRSHTKSSREICCPRNNLGERRIGLQLWEYGHEDEFLIRWRFGYRIDLERVVAIVIKCWCTIF